MLRILIADDHPVFLEGLRHVIHAQSDMVVTGEASNGHEVLRRVRSNKYDLVLLDITLPGKNGLEVLKELKIEQPNLAVLVMSMHPEEEYAIRVLRAGAAGYVHKDATPELLVSAIRQVSKGHKYISPSLAEKLALELGHDPNRAPHERLSDREFEVMVMIAAGKSAKEIADELCLSPQSVSTYRARVLEKMHMRNNADLMHYAITNNLLI